VLDALPFLVRVREQRRRDPGEIERALRSVLFAEGEDTLARASELATPVPRVLYQMLAADGAPSRRRVVAAALADPDVAIRSRAVEALTDDAGVEDRAGLLERLLRDDPIPAIRRLALTLISERMPDRLLRALPDVLLDRAAGVRGLARFIARTHGLPFVPRDVYVEALATLPPARIGAAIDGVGETGSRVEAGLIARFLTADRARIRRSALLAIARLDPDPALPAALAALADGAASARRAALAILVTHSGRLDFDG
jgi:HEAT repeat protein